MVLIDGISFTVVLGEKTSMTERMLAVIEEGGALLISCSKIIFHIHNGHLFWPAVAETPPALPLFISTTSIGE